MIKLPYTTASVIHLTKFTAVNIIIDHYKYHELLVVTANEQYTQQIYYPTSIFKQYLKRK